MYGKKLALSVFGILGSLSLVGCGGSAPAVSVAITPSATSVDGVSSGTADTVTVNAVVTNDSAAKGVTWAVSGAGTLSGSTTSATVFTPSASPSSAQSATITATSVADATKTASTTITIAAT